MQLTLVYAYGPFTNVQTRRTSDVPQVPITITRKATVQEDNVIGKFFRELHLNPFADPAAGQSAPLEIKKAMIGPVPERGPRLAGGRSACSASWRSSPSGRACACGWRCRS